MINSAGAPRIISWNIALRCPLKCSHGYVDADDDETDGVLSTHEAFSVVDKIRATGRPVVVLSGGETLLRYDVYDIVRYGTDQDSGWSWAPAGTLSTAIQRKNCGMREGIQRVLHEILDRTGISASNALDLPNIKR